MSFRNIALCSALLSVSFPLYGEARLNSPLDILPRAWTPIIDDLLLAYMNPQFIHDNTPSETTSSTSTTTLSPLDFSRGLIETAYLSKLLFAAEHGANIPLQRKKPTNPIDLLNSIPFPLNIFSEGFKRAAAAAGLDLDAYKKSIEETYQHKVAAMIQHGIIEPNSVARAVQDLEPQSFMSFIPSFDQAFIGRLRNLLPQSLASIPSVEEVMKAFNVEQGSAAEQSLRTLFPFFNVETLSQYMQMASQGIPLLDAAAAESRPMREAEEIMPGLDMWMPLLDTTVMRQYVDGFMGNSQLGGLGLEIPLQFMQDNFARFLPFSLA